MSPRPHAHADVRRSAEKQPLDVIVCGAGPAGLAVAAGLGQAGVRVVVCGQLPINTPEMPDRRTAALFLPSINFLKSLGVWPGLEPHCAPITGIRMVDDTGHLLRAPEVAFMARDAGLGAIGFNCPNPEVVAALCARISELPCVDAILGCRITAVETGPTAARVTIDDGLRQATLSAPLVVAADGRHSISRVAAGIGVRTWDYQQSALTAHIRHELSHHGVSTEFHGPGGPCTVIPMKGNTSALVLVDRPGAVGRFSGLGPDEFRVALEAKLHGLLGSITEVSVRRVFPLTGLVAKLFGADRTVLVGESGHAFPPIGAQGLNLGFWDAAALVDMTVAACAKGVDPGSDTQMAAFHASRRGDVAARVFGVDTLSASLTSALAPLVLGRGAMLHAAARMEPLRRYLIEQGLTSPRGLPESMRPTACV